MKILFAPLAGITHYFFLVPLAWACRAAGHDVRVAARPPHDVITASGLNVTPVGAGYDFSAGLADAHQAIQSELGRAPTPDDLRQLPPDVLARFRETRVLPHVRAAEAMSADLVPFVRDWRPDLVVTVPIVLAGPLAAAAAGAPLVRHLWGPDISRQAGFPGLGAPVEGWPGELVRLYERHGVEPRPDHAVRNLDPCPDSMQLPGVPNRVPMRYLPYNGSGRAPDWLRELTPGRPRVCVSWSVMNKQLTGTQGYMVPAVIQALASLDVEVLATVSESDRRLLGDVPDGVRLIDPVPLNLLLPHCDAVIHHGGAGTTLTAAYYGVPQIVVPPVTDQILNADQLAATGAGFSLHADRTGTDEIKSAVAQALYEDGPREAAARLRDEIHAAPAPAALVRTLEQLVREV
ncbi:DUF1205 domain-containing protein [Streptomyces armeniacus]|uniref:DUF1205 domain-containing protein n=1 Tax=Streptomyces armeniacus TaxID=83291 RepID=A0A345XXX6_9ACTN|nr:nucleotide disphospho-sugar-binding domain-containing protein [Streptomyces armeniacus]AXK36492.1 DUF1205 domain-containing protein [Streptomyces armeniacus]